MADPTGAEGEPALPEVTAGELVLGLLEGEERTAALRRLAREPAFARAVEDWRRWFGAWFAEWPSVTPPAAAQARLEAALDALRGGLLAATGQDNDRAGRGWRTLAIAASLAACLLLALSTALLLRPAPPAPPAPRAIPAPAPLLAAITPSGAGKPLPAAYDSVRGEVLITGRIAVPRGRDAQLWAIGGDGKPQPLGLLPGGGPTRVAVAAARRAVLVAGTTLAISIEPVGGSPTGQPTGPVVATGELNRG
jgi:anti-sigma-K factor RskA